jgi:hypothetical protein
VKALVVCLAAVAALSIPSLAFAGGQTGVIVKLDGRAGLAAVADAKGMVRLVHAPVPALRRLHPGARVRFDAAHLRNGTFFTTALTALGNVRSAHVRGMIFAVDARRGSFALSAHGAVLSLRLAKQARVPASCTCPRLNSTADVTVDFGQGDALEAAAVGQIDPTADAGAVDGTVTADSSGNLPVSSSGYTITVQLPSWFDPSQLAVGDHALVYFTRLADGSYALAAVSDDGSAGQADDPSGEQGDVQNADDEVCVDEQSGDQSEEHQGGDNGQASSGGSDQGSSEASGGDSGAQVAKHT